MLPAIAERASLPEADVRRLVLLRGSIREAATAVLGPARGAPPAAVIELFQPIAPMLAAPAASVDEALAGVDEAQLEWKIDGVRAQIHKRGARVAVYSRQGNDVTRGCAAVTGALASLPADTLVLDGEVVLTDARGIARPFQDSFSAIASGVVPEGDRLKVFLFDCVHKDGVDLLERPLRERAAILGTVAPAELLTPSARLSEPEEARRFYAAALAAGCEGVVVKGLSTPYRFGARGRAWQKVKEFATVDLVVLAAEWGSGRRKGLLSNLHLGARRADGSFCMVGKTFKGLTDEVLRWQTARFQELATEREGHVVWVEPRVVVEIRFNDVQRSSRYPGGVALRFARVVRYREDKSPNDVEPLDALAARAPGAARAKRGRKSDAKRRQLSLFDE